MLRSILNLEGVSLLSKVEQKNVNGGRGSSCKLTITEGGQNYVHVQYFTASTNAGISGAANNACVDIIQDGATRCKYDCAYDGVG